MPDLSSSQRSNATGDEVAVEVLHPAVEQDVEHNSGCADVRSDQPTSMMRVQGDEMVEHHYVITNGNSQLIDFSTDTQEVPESIAGMDSEEFNEGVGVLNPLLWRNKPKRTHGT